MRAPIAFGIFIRFPPPSEYEVPPITLRLCAAPFDEMDAKATASPNVFLLGLCLWSREDWTVASDRICLILLLPQGESLAASFNKYCCLLDAGRTLTSFGRLFASCASKEIVETKMWDYYHPLKGWLKSFPVKTYVLSLLPHSFSLA